MRRTTLFTAQAGSFFNVSNVRSRFRWQYPFFGSLLVGSAAAYYQHNREKTKIELHPLVKQYCEANGINKAETEKFVSRIIIACHHCGSDKPKEYINEIIKQSGSLALLASMNAIETIAFFKLAPFGVTPEEFLKHKKLFITDYQKYDYYGGIDGEIANTYTPALRACSFLLNAGMSFADTINTILEIKRLHPASHARLHALSDGLPIDYVLNYNDAQIVLFRNSESVFSAGFILSPQRIAELNIANDCDAFLLKCVLKHLLITNWESWSNTVRIINGEGLQNKFPSLFNAESHVPHADYVNKILFSRIFREEARKKLHLPASLLNDDCVWFNNNDELRALTKLVKEDGVDAELAIKELSKLNGDQKAIIIVGGSLAEAKQMYVGEEYRRTRPMILCEEKWRSELQKFRNQLLGIATPDPVIPEPKLTKWDLTGFQPDANGRLWHRWPSEKEMRDNWHGNAPNP